MEEKDNLRDCLLTEEVDLIGKAEDCLCNFLNAGITDYEMLENLMTTWHKNTIS